MESSAPSQTAAGVALLRAVHQLIDGPPRILDDPITPQLLDPAVCTRIMTAPPEFMTPLSLGLRAHVVARSRYAEDRLGAAAARGISQYLMLGAGLDTFPYRQPAWARNLRIIELDHPASQQWKRARLDQAGILIPDNLRYAAADLEKDSLADGLAAAGFDFTAPTVVSCLGVLVYLRTETVQRLIRFAGGLSRGSVLVFTYSTSDHESRLAARAAALGEPWQSAFEPDEWRRLLTEAGFSEVELVPPDTIGSWYFAGRTDGLAAPRRGSIAHAVV